MTMTVTHMSTAEAVAAMLTEPTGASILDSGDAYGRNWQRNADRGLADWQAQPRAWSDRWGCVSLSVFHYLTERVEYMPELDAAWQEWAEAADPDDRRGWLDLAAEYAELMHTGEAAYGELTEPRSWNTYNGEDALAQVLQGVTYCDDDAVYVLLQIHGGCDVRGGYTRPRVFRVDVDMAAYFPYDNADWTIYCQGECGAYWDVRGGYDVTDELGAAADRVDLEYGEGLDFAPCPKCGAALGVDAPHPY